MYLDDFANSKNAHRRYNQILATLKNVHGIDLNLSEIENNNQITQLVEQFTQQKNKIISENNFNTYLHHHEYVKSMLILEAVKIYLKEIAPRRMPKRKKAHIKEGLDMKTRKNTIMEQTDLAQAEVLLAAKDLVDQLQKMAEQSASMQVEDLMPLSDAMKEQFGPQASEAFSTIATKSLQQLLDVVKSSKETIDNALGQLQAGQVPTGKAEITNDMAGEMPAPLEPVAPESDQEDTEELQATKDEFGGAEAAAGPEAEPLGRAKKESVKAVGSALTEEEMKKWAVGYEYQLGDHFRSSSRIIKAKNEHDAKGKILDSIESTLNNMKNYQPGSFKITGVSLEESKVDEKWPGKYKPTKSAVGKWEDWTVSELKARRKKLLAKKEHSASESKELRQINFALSAKTGWGAVPESQQVEEKWGVKMKTKAKDVGKWEGWTATELKARRKKLSDKEERTAAESKELRQINFALRAKTGWGKIKESSGDALDRKLVDVNNLLASLSTYEQKLLDSFQDHRSEWKDLVESKQVTDTFGLGHGLEGETILSNLKNIRSKIDQANRLKEQIINSINEKVKIAEKISTTESKLRQMAGSKGYGIKVERPNQKPIMKFFETKKERDMWIDLNEDNDAIATLIDPNDMLKLADILESKKKK